MSELEKAARQALEWIEAQAEPRMIGAMKAITALREALAEQETVLPGGGHVPAVPVAVYGYCPECGGAGVMRERRPNGDDKCTNGHKYPSSKALAEQPAQQEPVAYAVYHRMGGSKTLHWPEQHSEHGDHNEYRLVPLYEHPPALVAEPHKQPAQQQEGNK